MSEQTYLLGLSGVSIIIEFKNYRAPKQLIIFFYEDRDLAGRAQLSHVLLLLLLLLMWLLVFFIRNYADNNKNKCK